MNQTKHLKKLVEQTLKNTDQETSEPITPRSLNHQLQQFGFNTDIQKCSHLLQELERKGVMKQNKEGAYVLDE